MNLTNQPSFVQYKLPTREFLRVPLRLCCSPGGGGKARRQASVCSPISILLLPSLFLHTQPTETTIMTFTKESLANLTGKLLWSWEEGMGDEGTLGEAEE